MFKQFIRSVDKKLGKFGIALGLAGVSVTAVACYGPPMDHEAMTQETLARYANMCDGGSCESYCQTNECAVVGNLETEPCDRNRFMPTQSGLNTLKVCNEQWRVEKLQCADIIRKEDGSYACATASEKNADDAGNAEPAQEPAQE